MSQQDKNELIKHYCESLFEIITNSSTLGMDEIEGLYFFTGSIEQLVESE
jgi:hypothetical protein